MQRHLFLLLSLVCATAAAQPFPSKPVRLVVGFTGGSTSDIISRIIAQKMTENLGQSVIIENRPGAGANIAAEYVAHSPPDGYVALFANTGISIAISAYSKLGYNVLRDLAPVAQVAASPHILVINPALPVKSVKELIALAKSRPGELNFASTGAGNSDHFAAELFKTIAGIDMLHVPYKGGVQATADVVGGQIAMYFAGMAVAAPLVKAGKVRALAVTSAHRSQALPEVPTMEEVGIKGYEHVLWNAVFVPAATPKEVIAKLDGEFAKAIASPDVRERLIPVGAEPQSRNAAEMAVYLRSEIDKYAKVVRAINLKLD
ncbi:MAG TPA: tripartite tricarboxylate transporter substrate binding protein [Burkholderiales bacterium]|nr:tripartite tricarboxylate transporter substrate binding protein [Burkholderiales bacterium]